MSAPGGGALPPALLPLRLDCARAQRCCRSLQRWSKRAGLRDGTGVTRAWAGLLLRFFDDEFPLILRRQRELLLPALMEGVAGSDPVCLRGMAALHEDGRTQVPGAWAVLRPGLAALAKGGRGEIPAAAVDAFARGCLALLSHAQDELLPMAERLLSDAQWEDMGRALCGPATAG